MSVSLSVRNGLDHVESIVIGDYLDFHKHHRLLLRLLVTAHNWKVGPCQWRPHLFMFLNTNSLSWYTTVSFTATASSDGAGKHFAYYWRRRFFSSITCLQTLWSRVNFSCKIFWYNCGTDVMRVTSHCTKNRVKVLYMKSSIYLTLVK